MDPTSGARGGEDDFFRRIVESSADALLVLDADLRIVYASPSALGLSGSDTGLAVGSDPLSFVHPDDVPVLVALAGDQLEGARYPLPLRFRIVRADGDVRTVEGVSIGFADGPHAGGLLVQLRDVTLADAVTPAAYRHERRFQRMLEHVADSVLLFDEQRRIITSTGLALRTLGGPNDLIDLDAVAGRCRPEHRERIDEMRLRLADGVGFCGAWDLTFELDGEWRTIEVRAFNYLHDPVIGAVVLIGREVTAERAAAAATAAAHEATLRALDQRREFVATVSHELRTPLHGILGVAELLADPRSSGDATELAGLISRSAESLLEMVDDILDLSRLEIGRLDLTTAPVDLADLAGEVAALFRPSAHDAGLTLTFSAEPEASWVSTDALRVRQVLTNLLSNAVKFTETGGISVAVGEVDRAGVAHVRISVTDSGPGIPADALPTLFEPFAQVRSSDAQRARGSGLGLAISRRLVDALGGTLSVDTAVDVGSTFVIELPAGVDGPGDADADHPAARPAVGAVASSGGPVVLVVEDDPTSQFLVEHQLAKLGYRCEVVSDGEGVVEAWERVDPVAVLMDDRLPGIDGRTATRRLREAEAGSVRPRVPVISVTASASIGELATAEAGIDEVLVKPVRLAALGEVLSRVAPTGPAAAVAEPAGG